MVPILLVVNKRRIRVYFYLEYNVFLMEFRINLFFKYNDFYYRL